MILKDYSQQDFNDYLNQSENNYAKEIQKSRNISFKEALEISNQEFQKTLSDGFNTKDNYFYKIVSNSQDFGMFWICTFLEHELKKVFIYDFEIKKQFRGQGYSKKAISLIEDRARELSAKAIGLHVFFHNEIAYKLYKSLGYKETKTGKKSSEMEKYL